MAARPNVVVIMADQMKATADQLYGSCFCETPALERLARAGTLFDLAVTPQPLCVPARVSLWSGRWPHVHGARCNEAPMPAGEAHAFRVWAEAGYDLAPIGKNHGFDDADDRALYDVWCEIGHEGLTGEAPRGMPCVRPEPDIDGAAPREHRNLAAKAGHEALIADLRGRLLAWSITTEDARPVPLPPPVAEPALRRGSTS